MCQRILCPVMVSVVVRINCLRFQSRDRVKLLDGCSAQTCQGTEYCTLNLRHLGVLHCIHQSVLCLRCMVLQLFGRVLLAKWRNLIEVHLKVVRHLLGQLVLRCLAHLQEIDSFVAALHKAHAALMELPGGNSAEGLDLGQMTIDLLDDVVQLRNFRHLGLACCLVAGLDIILRLCLDFAIEVGHALLCCLQLLHGIRLLVLRFRQPHPELRLSHLRRVVILCLCLLHLRQTSPKASIEWLGVAGANLLTTDFAFATLFAAETLH